MLVSLTGIRFINISGRDHMKESATQHEKTQSESGQVVKTAVGKFKRALGPFNAAGLSYHKKYHASIYAKGMALAAAVDADLKYYAKHEDAREEILAQLKLATSCLPVHKKLLIPKANSTVGTTYIPTSEKNQLGSSASGKKTVIFADNSETESEFDSAKSSSPADLVDNNTSENQQPASEQLRERVKNNTAVPHPPRITQTKKRLMRFTGMLLVGGALTFLVLSHGASAPISLWMLKIGVLKIHASLALGQVAALSAAGATAGAGAGLIGGAHVLGRSTGSAAAMQRFSATLSKQEKRLAARGGVQEKRGAEPEEYSPHFRCTAS